MLLQSALTFGLFARSTDGSIFAAAAIEVHELPDCMVTTVLQSLPTSPKQRSYARPPLVRNTIEGVQILKMYLSWEDVVTECINDRVGISELVATVHG